MLALASAALVVAFALPGRAHTARLLVDSSRAPVFCGGPDGHLVALTFDDGPGPYTRAALAVLRRNGARGTFFDIGAQVVLHHRLTVQESLQGAVGDHTWSHVHLTTLPTPAIYSELKAGLDAIAAATGVRPSLFRPPYGERNAEVDAVADSLGMLTVLWSVYSSDAAGVDGTRIAQLVAAGARPGSIVLMHENINGGTAVTALPAILAALRTKRLQAVTVPELLAADPPNERQLKTGPYACGPTVTGLSISEGPSAGGTTVMITGSGLNYPQRVLFGSEPARSFVFLSSSAIEAVSPPGSGTVDVTVTTHFSSSPTSALDQFTYR